MLLEVMASIVVITGGLLFIMRVYSTAKEALDRSRTLFGHSLLLEEKIFDFEEKGEAERLSKEYELAGVKNHLWSANAQPAALEGSSLNVLTLAVFQKNVSNPARHSLVTYLKDKAPTR